MDDEERIKRLAELARQKEEMERKRLAEQQNLQGRDQKTQQELKEKQLQELKRQQELSQRMGAPSGGQPGYQSSSPQKDSTVKYIAIVLVIAVVGFFGYRYKDDILFEGSKILQSIERMLPDDLLKSWSCILGTLTGKKSADECFGNVPPIITNQNDFIDVKFGSGDGYPLNPERLQKYSLPVRISNSKEKALNVEVNGVLHCTVESPLMDGDIEESFNLKASTPSFRIEKDEVSLRLESEEALPCTLKACTNAEVIASYSDQNDFTTSFTLGKTRQDALKTQIKSETSPGPISIRAEFHPLNYYYLGQNVQETEVIFTFTNKGTGKADIASFQVGVDEDTKDFFSSFGPCSCSCHEDFNKMIGEAKEFSINSDGKNGMDVILDQNSRCECLCDFKINENKVNGLPDYGASKTANFYFSVFYKFDRTEKYAGLALQGDKCSD